MANESADLYYAWGPETQRRKILKTLLPLLDDEIRQLKNYRKTDFICVASFSGMMDLYDLRRHADVTEHE